MYELVHKQEIWGKLFHFAFYNSLPEQRDIIVVISNDRH
jgi:hypothetical protein